MKRLIIAFVLCLPSTLLAQTFTYAPINVPRAAATEARRINASEEIVGFYKSASCSDSDVKVPNCPTHSFKYVNGSTAIMGVDGDLQGNSSKTRTSTSVDQQHLIPAVEGCYV